VVIFVIVPICIDIIGRGAVLQGIVVLLIRSFLRSVITGGMSAVLEELVVAVIVIVFGCSM